MALVNQQSNSRQGNANYVLYKLAAQQPTAFHDVTVGTIAMPCQTGTTNCITSRSGDAYGILSGYSAGAGYDLATGLGSVNAYNLVTKWNSVTLAPSVTTLSSLTPTTITHGQPVNVTVGVAPQSGTGTATGLVSLSGGPTGDVVDFDSHALTSGTATWTTSLLPGGSYNVTAHYPGDGNFSSSDSATSIPVTVNKENASVRVGLVTFDSVGRLQSSNAVTAPYGSPYILRISIPSTTCSSNSPGQAGCPSGVISLTENGSPLDAGTYSLNSLGYAEDRTVQLAGGAQSIQANYAGDNSFDPASGQATITITPATTTMTPPFAPFATVGISSYFNATVLTTSSGTGPTGTVSFTADGSPLSGTLSSSTVSGSADAPASTTFSLLAIVNTPGSHTITASYSGDANYAPSSSTATLNLRFADPSMFLSPASQTVQAGQSATLVALVKTTNPVATPTGTVLFQSGLDASTIAGNIVYTPMTDENGNRELQAQLTFVPPVSEPVYSSYAGDTNYGQVGSTTVYITVIGDDFILFPFQPSLTVAKGGSGLIELQIVGQSAYSGTVTFTPASCSGLPDESRCVFGPTSVTGTGTTELSISTTGTHQTATAMPISIRTAIWAVSLFTITCSIVLGGGSPTRRRGTWFSLAIAVVLLTLPSCGGGSSGGNLGNGGGGSIDYGTHPGTYTVTVTATSGSHTHTANFQLIVQ